MIDAKSISEEQKTQIQAWADSDAGLSGIQRRLNDEMGIKVTYMETRFLIDDLAIQMPEEEKPEVPEDEDAEDDAAAPDSEAVEDGDAVSEPETEAETESEPEAEPGDDQAGSVSVSISELQRPGAMVSGTVTFAGGESADWWMDQMGQLGMDPRNPEFRPSETDLMSFQKELQEVAKKKGF